MNKRHITINGRKYLYLKDNDTKEMTTSGNGYVWNQYGTTRIDIELEQESIKLNNDEYVAKYLIK